MTGPIIHRDIEQGTDAWHSLRAGKWSASKAAIIMGGMDTAGLKSLIKDVAWERVHGATGGGFKSAAMERGNELEPESRDWYAFEKGVSVEQVGMVEHATIPDVSWSPDGLCERGAIEAKNPEHRAFMEVQRTGKIPSEYRWQCRWAMWVGELEWMDFVVYHPAAGGIIIPCEVTDAEKQAMAERVAELEPLVAEWIEITNRKNVA